MAFIAVCPVHSAYTETEQGVPERRRLSPSQSCNLPLVLSSPMNCPLAAPLRSQ